jgi:maleylacetate reductase
MSFPGTLPAAVRLPMVSARFVDGQAGPETAAACTDLGISKPLFVGTGQAETRYASIWKSLSGFDSTKFFGAAPHCPDRVVEACRQTYRSSQRDGVIAIGGGSTLGLGKILAAEEGAKFIALPTTYSGSEMTAIFGRKVGGQKRTAMDDRCRPDRVIYDGQLSKGLSMHLSVTSAMNSIAHAAEALYPQVPNPLAATLAEQCLRAHQRGLLALYFDQADTAARTDLLYGAFLGGLVIGMCGIALHHQLCHVIGGLYDLPHAASNSAVLPQVLAYNRSFIPAADRTIAGIFGGKNAAQAVFHFARQLHAPLSLKEIGMPEEGVEAVVQGTLEHWGYNPRPPDESALRQLVRNAYDGILPS